MKYIRPKSFTPIQQLIGLKKNFGNGEWHVKKNILHWQGVIRPVPVSREYVIRMIYKFGSKPSIYIVKPNLKELSKGRQVPHLYSQKEQKLCLYMPIYMEWKPNQHISTTIIPWIYLWLFYFEEWLFSNEWKGGGERPKPKD